MRSRALICGVTGQDGAYLARLLTRAGAEVHGTSRAANPECPNLVRLQIADSVEIHRLDPADKGEVVKVMEQVQPTEIYYLAAQSSVGRSFDLPDETWIASAVGIQNILAAGREAVPGARVFYAASGECFGETRASSPATESTPFAPLSPYARAKCAGHEAVCEARAQFGQFACSGFLFSHESPLRPERFVGGKIASAVRRISNGSQERLRLGNLATVRDWGWAPEYVEAMARMLKLDEPRDFIIATGQSHTLGELVDAIFSAAGLCWRDHVDAETVPPRPSACLAQHADPSLARDLLGWEARVDLPSLAERLVREKLD